MSQSRNSSVIDEGMADLNVDDHLSANPPPPYNTTDELYYADLMDEGQSNDSKDATHRTEASSSDIFTSLSSSIKATLIKTQKKISSSFNSALNHIDTALTESDTRMDYQDEELTQTLNLLSGALQCCWCATLLKAPVTHSCGHSYCSQCVVDMSSSMTLPSSSSSTSSSLSSSSSSLPSASSLSGAPITCVACGTSIDRERWLAQQPNIALCSIVAIVKNKCKSRVPNLETEAETDVEGRDNQEITLDLTDTSSSSSSSSSSSDVPAADVATPLRSESKPASTPQTPSESKSSPGSKTPSRFGSWWSNVKEKSSTLQSQLQTNFIHAKHAISDKVDEVKEKMAERKQAKGRRNFGSGQVGQGNRNANDDDNHEPQLADDGSEGFRMGEYIDMMHQKEERGETIETKQDQPEDFIILNLDESPQNAPVSALRVSSVKSTVVDEHDDDADHRFTLE